MQTKNRASNSGPKKKTGAKFKKAKIKNIKAEKLISIALGLAIVIVGVLIVVRKVLFERIQGPGWDVFAFLGNALQYAGKGIGYWEPHRPPVFSFLTSLFFRTGFVTETTIFIVDGILFIAGLIGLYLLLKRRFDPFLSFLGTLFFSSIHTVLWWTATGMTDVPAVSLSIWAIYLFVVAAEDDSRYHLLAWPIFFAAVFTRYTVILMVFPVLLILLARSNIFKEVKHMVSGIAISIVMFIPYFIMNYKVLGDALYPLISAFTAVTVDPVARTITSPARVNKVWYITNFREMIVPANMQILFYLSLFMIFIGLTIYAIKLLKDIEQKRFALIGLVIAISVYVFVFLNLGLVARQASIFIIGLVLLLFFKGTVLNKRGMWLDIVILAWFMVYFDFHSHIVPHQRYFVTMTPAITYFTLLGINNLIHVSKQKMAIVTIRFATIIVLTIVIASSFVSFHNWRPNVTNVVWMSDMKEATKWLRKRDPNVKSKKVFSEYWVYYSWYLKQDVKPLAPFKDKRAPRHELEKYSVDYYLTPGKRDIRSYDLIKKVGQSGYIYRKNVKKFRIKPRILYIGKNWQHYIEDVTDFHYFVVYEATRYGTGKSIYIDNYTVEELRKYPVILLYNFRWKNRLKAENTLEKYVRQGGNIIIDASGNLSKLQNNLDEEGFLDIHVQRKYLQPNPKIEFKNDMAGKKIAFSPFLEIGQRWQGATYKKFTKDTNLEKLVTADRDILIGRQKLGKGHIYWIAYNFVWHAFDKDNLDERALIDDLFKRALENE